MMKQGRGCIINVSSMASLAAERQAPMAYCVAKAALNHMTSFAASDYARYGIRVNAILPGTTSTPMLHNVLNEDQIRDMVADQQAITRRSEEHTSELQSLMRISYAVFCLKKKKIQKHQQQTTKTTRQKKKKHK